jgi:putative salt-induced outer membrane protein YdiY
MNLHRTLLAACAMLAAASALLADVVETKNGARLVGTVTKIDGSHVTLATEYAGTLTIKQSEVVSLSTEKPLNVRLAGGTVLQGTLASAGAGQVQLTGSDGTINTTVDKLAMTWSPGAEDPAIEFHKRSWAYEVGLDVTGKTGNSEQLGTAVSGRATLTSAQDKLQFYTALNRQESDGVKSADQFKAGVDYANNFSGKKSWYVRNEGGFDRIKDIELYNVTAAGLGYDLIKAANQTLTGRAGLSYRYEGYRTTLIEDVRSAGLDVGFAHRIQFENSVLTTNLSYVPAFDDFAKYVAFHESYFEMPITASLWKLRIGVSNDYNSEPGPGVKGLDTTYFTRLILNWK